MVLELLFCKHIYGGLFAVDIKSSHVRKIGNGSTKHDVIAYMNFHTPGTALILKVSKFEFITSKC